VLNTAKKELNTIINEINQNLINFLRDEKKSLLWMYPK